DNNPAWVASGPTVPNDTTPARAQAILAHYDIAIAAHVRSAMEHNQPATSAAGGQRHVSVSATATDALDAAHAAATRAGIAVQRLGDALEGEARELGREHARQALQLQTQGLTAPLLLLS